MSSKRVCLFSTLMRPSRLQDGDIPALPPMFNRRQAEEWRKYPFPFSSCPDPSRLLVPRD